MAVQPGGLLGKRSHDSIDVDCLYRSPLLRNDNSSSRVAMSYDKVVSSITSLYNTRLKDW